jgi:hypothetical protein
MAMAAPGMGCKETANVDQKMWPAQRRASFSHFFVVAPELNWIAASYCLRISDSASVFIFNKHRYISFSLVNVLFLLAGAGHLRYTLLLLRKLLCQWSTTSCVPFAEFFFFILLGGVKQWYVNTNSLFLPQESKAMLSSTNDLSAHLLGSHQAEEDDEHHPGDHDEEEGFIPCFLKNLYDEELEDFQSSSENKASYFLSFVLHVLLIDYFVISTGLHWSLVNFSIILFVAISIIYRQAIKVCKPTYSAVILLPEILQVVILSPMLFDNIDAAFCFLLISILFLTVSVAVISIRGYVITATSIKRKKDLM